MSRNQNSLFSTLPSIDIRRSRFRRPQSVKFTANTGELIPFYIDEVLPGDTHQIKTNKVVRLQTPITPFMDQMYLDVYYFFVPNRLVWDHWKEFNGENTTGPWIQQPIYTIPQQTTVLGRSVQPGTPLDYLGIPVNVDNLSFSHLPLRSYYLIWNEWFRDQNLQYPVVIYKGDNSNNMNVNAQQNPADGSTAITSSSNRIMLAGKFRDYFSASLPAPQKGPDVTLGMVGNIPVVGTDTPFTLNNGTADFNLAFNQPISNPGGLYASDSVESGSVYGAEDTGLVADLSGISVATINQLRTAFQLQKLYEADARGGSRYTEILRQHFGVISPDARLQRPEYLGGNRVPINVHQVVQSSETGSTPQGTTAAYSLTVDAHGDFIRSFTEHGFIIGLACVRYDHTYQQGIERFWSRKTRLDYFWPVLAHLGEQAVLNKEVYAQGSSAVDSDGNPYDEQVFGYQEAWSDYRYKPSRVAGEMRSNLANSLDVWHLADDYSSLPALSAGWIAEDKSNVDRVLQVTSSVSNQLLFDFYVENISTRPMPLHSVPGLVDHF